MERESNIETNQHLTQPNLLDLYSDKVVTIFGFTDTLGALSEMCPEDLSGTKTSLEAKNEFVVKALNESEQAIEPEHEELYLKVLEKHNLERKFTILDPNVVDKVEQVKIIVPDKDKEKQFTTLADIKDDKNVVNSKVEIQKVINNENAQKNIVTTINLAAIVAEQLAMRKDAQKFEDGRQKLLKQEALISVKPKKPIEAAELEIVDTSEKSRTAKKIAVSPHQLLFKANTLNNDAEKLSTKPKNPMSKKHNSLRTKNVSLGIDIDSLKDKTVPILEPLKTLAKVEHEEQTAKVDEAKGHETLNDASLISTYEQVSEYNAAGYLEDYIYFVDSDNLVDTGFQLIEQYQAVDSWAHELKKDPAEILDDITQAFLDFTTTENTSGYNNEELGFQDNLDLEINSEISYSPAILALGQKLKGASEEEKEIVSPIFQNISGAIHGLKILVLNDADLNQIESVNTVLEDLFIELFETLSIEYTAEDVATMRYILTHKEFKLLDSNSIKFELLSSSKEKVGTHERKLFQNRLSNWLIGFEVEKTTDELLGKIAVSRQFVIAA